MHYTFVLYFLFREQTRKVFNLSEAFRPFPSIHLLDSTLLLRAALSI